MKLNVRAFGLAIGILWGAAMLVMAIAVMLLPGQWGEAVVSLLSNLYVGYEPSVFGAFIGGAWGFADGLIGGVILAWLYNKLAGN